LGLAVAPAAARAQTSRIGSILSPSGVYYPTPGKAKKDKGNKNKREYIDASGCRVKEENKPDGDYKYERNCKHADKNLQKARKDLEKGKGKNKDVDRAIWLPRP